MKHPKSIESPAALVRAMASSVMHVTRVIVVTAPRKMTAVVRVDRAKHVNLVAAVLENKIKRSDTVGPWSWTDVIVLPEGPEGPEGDLIETSWRLGGDVTQIYG